MRTVFFQNSIFMELSYMTKMEDCFMKIEKFVEIKLIMKGKGSFDRLAENHLALVSLA